MFSTILSKDARTLINAHLLLLVHEEGRLLCVLLGYFEFEFDIVHYKYNNDSGAFKDPNTSNPSY